MLQRTVRSLISKIPETAKPISICLHKPSIHFLNPSKFSPFHLSPSVSSTQFSKTLNPRNFTTIADHSKDIDDINLKFAEAREEIDAALESKETVYFDEEAECAREAVKEVLDKFEGLLGKLEEKEKMALLRSMGLKMEQLKAELKQLDD